MPATADRYRDITTAEIVELHDQGQSHRKIGKLLRMGPCAVGNRLRKAGKVRPAVKVSATQLKEVRLDPAWEARQENHGVVPANRVVCRVCGERKSEINAHGLHSHLRKHRMTADEYKSKYPGARLVSHARSAKQNSRQGRTKTVHELMDEFAARYLRPEDLRKYRRDPEWEEHHHITEFIVCRLCGMKSQTDLHSHLKAWHGLTSAQYRERFPKCLQIPLGLYDGRNARAKIYGRKKRKDANIGKAVTKSEAAGRIVLYLLQHRDASNADALAATETALSARYMTELRTLSGVPSPVGRPKVKTQRRAPSGAFHRQ